METKAKPLPKDNKRRNNEKRKEKSRDAARCRRSRETEIFTDLANSLPLVKDQTSQLDKASIMRLAISYLRVRDMINIVPQLELHSKTVTLDESIFLNSLEGFLFVISLEGDFVYLSENVSEYIGITQIDLMGQSVYEYAHPCDHDEIKDMLVARHSDGDDTSKSFFIRFKCTLTSKGRSVNIKSATYKVIHCTGHMLHKEQQNNNKTTSKIKKEEKSVEEAMFGGGIEHCLVAVGKPIEHPENIETPLGQGNFLSKHTLDMKFTYADERMMEIMGYDPDELIGKSLYEYYHAMDSDIVCSAFKALFSKGQCETARYRFLARKGGYVWVLTQATLINDKGRKPTSIVCVNYLISGIECEDKIYSYAQACALESDTIPELIAEEDILEEEKETQEKEVVNLVKEEEEAQPVKNEASVPIVARPEEVSPPLVPQFNRPAPTVTSKIFAPRTEDMNKGYLMFSDTEPGLTMLKDEPDDLTHLAPVAGDVCVSLDDAPFLSEMLDDFLLKDGFSPLLTDEPSDPFISYRENSDLSPQMLSPNLSKRSDSSLPSLNSPGGSLGDEDQMSTFMTLPMDDEDAELLMRAPYIPMGFNDDLPMLLADEYMWNSNGANNENVSETNKNNSPDINSSLAQLLCSSNKSSKMDPDGGGNGGGKLKNNNQDVLNELYCNDESSKNKNWNNIRNSSTCHQKSTNRITSDQHLLHNKRTNSASIYETSNKRQCKTELPKEKMSSELLQQLMSNNVQRGRPKGGKGSNWLLDSGQKATCISQPSDSVLMNLLEQQLNERASPPRTIDKLINGSTRACELERKRQLKPPDTANSSSVSAIEQKMKRRSFSLLDPEAAEISPHLFDLTQQDYEVNAPVANTLLQGSELLTALDATSGSI